MRLKIEKFVIEKKNRSVSLYGHTLDIYVHRHRQSRQSVEYCKMFFIYLSAPNLNNNNMIDGQQLVSIIRKIFISSQSEFNDNLNLSQVTYKRTL